MISFLETSKVFIKPQSMEQDPLEIKNSHPFYVFKNIIKGIPWGAKPSDAQNDHTIVFGQNFNIIQEGIIENTSNEHCINECVDDCSQPKASPLLNWPKTKFRR